MERLTRLLPSILARTGAALLIAASTATGALYAAGLGSEIGPVFVVVLIAAALGGEAVKPVAVAAAIDAARNYRIGTALALGALATLCVLYSFSAALSLAAGSRGDLAATRGQRASVTAMAQARYADARKQLEALPAARPAAAIEAEITRLLADRRVGDCRVINGPVSRRVCPVVSALRSEAATAAERSRLQSVMIEAEQAIAAQRQTAGVADPLAASIAAYAGAAGLSTSAEWLAPWLALVPVLFLEVGSALSIFLVRAVSTPVSVANSSRTVSPETPSEPAEKTPAQRLIAVVASNGGMLETNQRNLAERIGLSKSRTNEVIAELVARGDIHVEASPLGTRIRAA